MVFDWEFIHSLLFIFYKLWGLILLVPTCCSCSVVKTYLTLWTLWTVACQVSLYFTISWSLLNSMSVESVIPSNHLLFKTALFSFCLQSLLAWSFFSSETALFIRWPKYWSFSFSISPSSEHLGLISFRIDCFDSLSSPALQLESISSSVVSLLYGPALRSLHDY